MLYEHLFLSMDPSFTLPNQRDQYKQPYSSSDCKFNNRSFSRNKYNSLDKTTIHLISLCVNEASCFKLLLLGCVTLLSTSTVNKIKPTYLKTKSNCSSH